MAKKNPFALFQGAQKAQKVTINGIDQPVFLRRITVAEQAKIQKLLEAGDTTRATLALFIFGTCDENGAALGTLDDADTLAETLDAGTMQAVVIEINRINGFDKSEDDAEKN